MGTKTQKLSNVVDQIVEWQSVFTGDGSTGLTAVAGRGYFIDTTSGTVTVTLPTDANSKLGDTIVIRDYAGTFATNNVTITSTAKISEADADGTLSTNDLVVTLVYVDSTKGWVTLENEAKAIGAEDVLYVSATGGTITTSGDYKIHTFTGDGCFVVSCAGNASGSSTVDYLVVAGGGAGSTVAGVVGGYASGGGGAGGYRESSGAASGCYSVSPLGACVSALPVSTTTYPITVGGGGATQPYGCSGTHAPIPGMDGSNSIFSTITSTGGGGAGTGCNTAPDNAGRPGGSGGGGGARNAPLGVGGTGNTPPVSPPQGQSGGTGTCSNQTAAGGGGGATVAGSSGAPGAVGGDGGDGATSSIDGTPTARAGGGGGGSGYPGGTAGNAGSGGTGGGGAGNNSSPTGGGIAGTANTGGGGGGGGSQYDNANAKSGGAGGKGIVIIRYKYQ